MFHYRRSESAPRSKLSIRSDVSTGSFGFGAHFNVLSLYFLYQKGNLKRVKTGLDTYVIRIPTRPPCLGTRPYDYSKSSRGDKRAVS